MTEFCSEHQNRKGILIVVEGGDGVGKNTQQINIVNYLRDKYGESDVEFAHTLGGTPYADAIRATLLEKRDTTFDVVSAGYSIPPLDVVDALTCAIKYPYAETKKETPFYRTDVLLLAASRAQTMLNLVSPALVAGKIVIMDRCNDSTIVYQGLMHEQSKSDRISNFTRIRLEHMQPILDYAMLGVVPDLVVTLVGHSRNRLNAQFSTVENAEDKFSANGDDFHERINFWYDMYNYHPDLFDIRKHNASTRQVINANQSVDDVFDEIKQALLVKTHL